jgi:TfoX/Sxy family transcriptional regulator of competence genes
MAYDMELDDWVRDDLSDMTNGKNILAKKMFGGVGYLLAGNMAAGILGQDLILRVGEKDGEALLGLVGFKPFLNHASAKPMKGWVSIAKADVPSRDRMCEWLALAVAFASSLPAK